MSLVPGGILWIMRATLARAVWGTWQRYGVEKSPIAGGSPADGAASGR
jgi:hypothetical protein